MLLGQGNKFGFVSTNQRIFGDKDPKAAIVPPNKDFIHSIKTNHFDIGSVRPKSLFDVKRHYLSEANLSYSMKGDASKLRSKLDEAKKADLRTHHFNIGGPTADFKHPMATLQYRPSTAKERTDARPMLNAAKKNDLRASHWGVGNTSVPDLSAARGCRNSTSSKTMPVTKVAQRPETAFVTTSMVNFKWV